MESPESAPALLRVAALHAFVREHWAEDPDQPGHGRLTFAGTEPVQHAWDFASRPDVPDSDAWLFVLGLFLESEDPHGTAGHPVRDFIAAHLESLLDRLAAAAASDDPVEQRVIQPLMYVLGQVREYREAIAAHCARVIPKSSPWHAAAEQLFAAELPGGMTRSIVAYLGAGAAGEIPPDRLPMLAETLACPTCRGRLEFVGVVGHSSSAPPNELAAPSELAGADPSSGEPGLQCATCVVAYRFEGDLIDLRPADFASDTGPEFDDALVRRYETMTRPRFVRTMSRDWDRTLTPEVEEAYLARHLNVSSGPVLDLACGAGGWTERVARQVGAERVLALDVSMPMMRACHARVPRAIGLCADATRLPLRDGSLAGANCSDALQALPDPAAGLREVARCLRPGAPFTALTFVQGDGLYRYFQHRVPLHSRHLFTEEGLRSMLAQAGLEVIDWSQRGLAVFFTARTS